MAVSMPLAAIGPNNTWWQRDLAVSHDRIANLQLVRVASSEALASYRADLPITELLVATDPDNAASQWDLVVICGPWWMGVKLCRQGR